ncbi:hypothetical protein [Ammoniphilus resinae]|uniref:Uncharacterized protein n=1 Tax=Ammoniphilus resinae TaxID=861532 RepID=A0ABS4GN78_9BACL|nr:hypothetical protein [Ammoniphilus resinae]MBP1931701.1 hypothetical protein [Ammoniphilus resinae]
MTYKSDEDSRLPINLEEFITRMQSENGLGNFASKLVEEYFNRIYQNDKE